MKYIYIIDDIELEFNIASEVNIIKYLSKFYQINQIDEVKINLLIISSDSDKEKEKQEIERQLEEQNVDSNQYSISIVQVGNDPYEDLDHSISTVLNSINVENYKVLLDVSLTKRDLNRLQNEDIILSNELCKIFGENCFLYTQYSPNEYMVLFNVQMKKIKPDFKEKRIYFRGEINGETKFDKKLALKLVGGENE